MVIFASWKPLVLLSVVSTGFIFWLCLYKQENKYRKDDFIMAFVSSLLMLKVIWQFEGMGSFIILIIFSVWFIWFLIWKL